MATPKRINSKEMYLFDDKSRDDGSIYNTKITIGSSDGIIEGHLTDPFKWNMSASWKSLFEGLGKLSLIQKGFDVTGEHLFKQGVFTRKYYKGGSYIEIPLKFRVTDYNGEGNVMVYSSRLANMMLPRSSQIQAIKKVGNALTEDLSVTGEKIVNTVTGYAGTFNEIQKYAKGSVKGASDVESVMDQLERDQLGTKYSTFAVSVTVGNVFSNSSMVVESGSVTYSNAQVKNKQGITVGPLYGDFDIKLSARSVRSKGKSGVRRTPSFTNVTINK